MPPTSTAADIGIDSDAHHLVYAADAAVLAAATDIRRAIQYGHWVGPWDDTIDTLRRAAHTLRQLQALGPPTTADAAPCHWCGRPTTETPGHRSCHARAWHPTPTAATPTAAPAPPATPVDAAPTTPPPTARATPTDTPPTPPRTPADVSSATTDPAAPAPAAAAPATMVAPPPPAPSPPTDAAVASPPTAAPPPAPSPATTPPLQADASSPPPDPTAPAPAPRATVRRPPVRTFFQDAATERADFTRAVRRITARDHTPPPSDTLITAALHAWHTAVTAKDEPCRFVSSSGHTGVSAYHWLMTMHGAMTKPTALRSERVEELSRRDRTLIRSLSFVDPDTTPVVGQVITEVDVNAQYLAAARSVDLGDGEPVELDHVDPADLPALLKRPGYLRLATTPDLTNAPAHLRHALPRLVVGAWLPTPIAAYLHRDHNIGLDIAGAITWPASGRRLSVWCEMFANGRATLTATADTDPAAALALRVVKDVYTRYLGGYLRSKTHNRGPTCRTDWHDMLVAQGVANAARAIDKTVTTDGTTVLGSLKDAYWLLADTPTHPTVLTFSPQPGKWKRNRVAPVTPAVIDAHRTGRVGLLRQAITASDTAASDTAAEDTP
ncbi:hypothetical protein [Umezawaea sp. Da 62-37]|uniref:hypothetical protein n=1 Tax=Umezawaea sp. Da 62-37 TaxID=3075927 RepID=UPI0028F6ED84|nr:hypothetical protein [Umezawaea sp. Da 62-37]WNV86643.1 hypothetical protein RM788_52450 [Umezawaea sp. Da 62-37]WNV86774.1 hypothetical protein RM788_00355 [Umezawaea sp. Da 62-37]